MIVQVVKGATLQQFTNHIITITSKSTKISGFTFFEEKMKIIYILIGFICVILGSIGVVLPILPTTPFLLLALICFSKSSQRVENWFKSTSLYQKHLESFVTHRAMTLKTKVGLLGFASTMLIIAFLMVEQLHVRLVVIGLIIFKYYYFIFKIQTIKEVSVSD